MKEMENDLKELCLSVHDRHVGSPGNQKVTKYMGKKLLRLGYKVEMPQFDCIDWDYGGCLLTINNQSLKAYISPYSLPCNLEGAFVTASTIHELQDKDFSGKIAVLHGKLCKEQLMPKQFSFYNPDHHKRIVTLLEKKSPVAIVAIMPDNTLSWKNKPAFPLIEDGDFHIPSVYLSKTEGDKIIQQPDSNIKLIIDSTRVETIGCNVIGFKKGAVQKKIVFSAHIDTKKDTPGALDNASGVTVLLGLANVMKDFESHYNLEFVLFNGEDYYAQSGEMLYLEKNKDSMQDIVLNINVDGAGYEKGKNSFCYFQCEGKLKEAIEDTFNSEEGFVKIDEWHQGDHMIFVMNGVPAIAISSEHQEIVTEIAHTRQDHLGRVDLEKLYEIIVTLKQFGENLEEKV